MKRSCLTLLSCLLAFAPVSAGEPSLTLERTDHWLIIHGTNISGRSLRINYLEAYCRAGSTNADWGKHTVIQHRSEVVSRSQDGKVLRLKDTLADGVVVQHVITAKDDEIDFRLQVSNPTEKPSEAHWAQPCVRLASFTGFAKDAGGNLDDYLPKCFVFLNGQLARMPTMNWAKEARYTPGQVWRPLHVSADDVNPRPVSNQVTSNGLIGCFSADEKMVFAMAAEPYQELFQGVARCLHSDFRIGGLKPGEKKFIRSKIYLVKNDIPTLLKRYQEDFPEHTK
jgi:hypothetical protein